MKKLYGHGKCIIDISKTKTSECGYHSTMDGNQHICRTPHTKQAHTHTRPSCTCRVRHGDGCAHFIVNSVELGEHHTIDQVHIATLCQIAKMHVELTNLVHCIIAHQGLANKQNLRDRQRGMGERRRQGL